MTCFRQRGGGGEALEAWGTLGGAAAAQPGGEQRAPVRSQEKVPEELCAPAQVCIWFSLGFTLAVGSEVPDVGSHRHLGAVTPCSSVTQTSGAVTPLQLCRGPRAESPFAELLLN